MNSTMNSFFVLKVPPKTDKKPKPPETKSVQGGLSDPEPTVGWSDL